MNRENGLYESQKFFSTAPVSLTKTQPYRRPNFPDHEAEGTSLLLPSPPLQVVSPFLMGAHPQLLLPPLCVACPHSVSDHPQNKEVPQSDQDNPLYTHREPKNSKAEVLQPVKLLSRGAPEQSNDSRAISTTTAAQAKLPQVQFRNSHSYSRSSVPRQKLHHPSWSISAAKKSILL